MFSVHFCPSRSRSPPFLRLHPRPRLRGGRAKRFSFPSPPEIRDKFGDGAPFVYRATRELRSAVSRGSRGRPSSGRKNGGRVRRAPGGTWRDSGFISRKMKIEVESCARGRFPTPLSSRRWTSSFVLFVPLEARLMPD